ncbi:MAG: HEAT repeat domain-containing protein [Candidatus Methylomirabilales bacterium]
MSKFDEILDKAVEHRHLSPEELEMVKSELLDPETSEDRSNLLHILGHVGNPSMVPIVEGYLDWREDPYVAAMALQVLCDSWGLYDEYRHVLIRFMRRVPWDEDEEVRNMAISCAGESLRERRDPELALVLMDMAQDESEEELTRSWAMRALARGAGFSYNEMPGVRAGLRPDSDLGRMILERARSLL